MGARRARLALLLLAAGGCRLGGEDDSAPRDAGVVRERDAAVSSSSSSDKPASSAHDAAPEPEPDAADSGIEDAGAPITPPTIQRRTDHGSGPLVGAGARCADVSTSPPRLRACEDGASQTWSLGAEDSLRALGQCLDVVEPPARLGLAGCDPRASTQAFVPLDGELIHAASGQCLSAGDDGELTLAPCGSTETQRWTVPRLPAADGDGPDLGPKVLTFSASQPTAAIQRRLNAVLARQERNQFGPQRFALLFAPGEYRVDVNVGFYTHVAGLGRVPDDARIYGAVHVEADWFPDHSQNATQNFWRAAENLAVIPSAGFDRWAVSQAAPYRRMHLSGDLRLDDGGWSSGGFMADSCIDGEVWSGSQQQWLTRSSDLARWNGANWNMVFAGVNNAPDASFPSPPYTVLDTVPRVREKPFLFIDPDDGQYKVFVPALQTEARGTTWRDGPAQGTALPLADFAIIREGDDAAKINAALADGKHLLVTPGVYPLAAPLQIAQPDTVVLGLGLPTFIPRGGFPALAVADVDGVKLAGLLIDAGPQRSPALVQLGDASVGPGRDHAANPSSLHDVFVRIGGATRGAADVSVRIDSSHVIGDNVWLWRADHGENDSVGWSVNPADTGLLVAADDVTIYGLFVEHYQKYQVLWRGERGQTYFFQNEAPYDVPDQAAWLNGATAGYAAYKVDDAVTTHDARGLGSYCFFSVNPDVVLAHAFEVPPAGIQLKNLVTVSLGGKGTIAHVINDSGAAVSAAAPAPAFLTTGP